MDEKVRRLIDHAEEVLCALLRAFMSVVMMTVNMAVGTVTPPVALNLYVAANLSGISMERISRAALPFIAALIAALLIITFIPSLSLWLPGLLKLR